MLLCNFILGLQHWPQKENKENRKSRGPKTRYKPSMGREGQNLESVKITCLWLGYLGQRKEHLMHSFSVKIFETSTRGTQRAAKRRNPRGGGE